MIVELTIPGKPFGKQRPRSSRRNGVHYTPKETVLHENAIAMAYKAKYGAQKFPPNKALNMIINAYIPIPKSATKSDKLSMHFNTKRPTVKPDVDNIAKLVADALNGIAYDDDKYIVCLEVNKYYSDTPCTVIKIM